MSNGVYIGLNLENSLSEIQDKQTALSNIGLNIDDVERIRGLDEELIRDELFLLANLDLDQKAELWSLFSSVSAIEEEISGINDIRFPLNHNYNINNQVQARAIKYDFFDRAKGNQRTRKADISTSRVSSWSSTESPTTQQSPIFYGGDLNVRGDIKADSLRVLSDPIPKKYSAEVATHLVTVKINGVEKQFYAMRGIPLTFRAFFRNANLEYQVSPVSGVTPVWEILNVDDQREFVKDNNSDSDVFRFRDNLSRLRDVRFYYSPNQILRLDLPSISLSEVTTTPMANLQSYDLSLNNLDDTPEFVNLTPVLETLNLRGNNLSRSSDSPNVQIGPSRLPISLKSIDISGCFTGEPGEGKNFLDLSHLTSLEELICTDRYRRRSRRGFSGNLESPSVNSSTIKRYIIYGQGAFRTLHFSVQAATGLEELNIRDCNMGGVFTLATNNLRTFSSRNNSHAVLDVSGTTTLTNYVHQYSSISSGSSSINAIFEGCESLQSINFYRTSITGDIGIAFKELPSLTFIDVRRTRISGSLTADSFQGTEELRRLYIQGGTFDSGTPFFSSGNALDNLPNLERLIVQYNSSITGSLPSFERNLSLNRLYIRNTGLSGSIPDFGSNRSLQYIYMQNNAFTGSVPELSGNQFITADFSNNSLNGKIPILSATNLRNLYLSNNDLSDIIPSFESCTRLRRIRLASNNLDGYTPKSLSKCNNLIEFDVSNNSLRFVDALEILQDLVTTYVNNRRRRVTINFLGNSEITQSAIEANDSGRINFDILRAAGWNILINP